MGFTVFKEIILWDYYLSRRVLEEFSNAFDVLECKHNLRLPWKEGPPFCYSELWPLIVVVSTKGEKWLRKRKCLNLTEKGISEWSRMVIIMCNHVNKSNRSWVKK